LRPNPIPDAGLEHVQRQGALAEKEVVERAQVEALAEGGGGEGAQLLDLQLPDLVRQGLGRRWPTSWGS